MSAQPTPKADGGKEPLFDAVLRPHRSLGRFGFYMLMGSAVVVSFAAGVVFFLRGVWPVVGFLAIDVVLIYLAFKVTYRGGRAFETLRLSPRSLTVRRVDPSGDVHTWRFEPYWVRVEMTNLPGHPRQLTVSSHGRRVTVGVFLTPKERLEVADALNSALRKFHCVRQTTIVD